MMEFSDIDKFGYGWHGPSVKRCPHCGGELDRKNWVGKHMAARGQVCPECYPLRKRLWRWLTP